MSKDLVELVNTIELSIHPSETKPVLRALISAIFFHRTLDNIEPETVEISDTQIAVAPNREVEKEVESKIEEFIKRYPDAGAEEGQIAIVFLQRKPKKGWFAITEELIPWEEHLIHLSFTPSSPPSSNRDRDDNPTNTAVSSILTTALLQILTFCGERKGNVPPLVGAGEQSNISHQILIAPPPPSDLFAPSSPPLYPTRLTSPPPSAAGATTTITPAVATASPAPARLATTDDVGSNPASAPASGPALGSGSGPGSGPGMVGLGTATAGVGGGAGPTHAQAQLEKESRRRSASPATTGMGIGMGMGYLEQAKEGFRAVRAGAGAVAGWGGRGTFGRGA